MTGKADGVVMCKTCGEHAAEIVAKDDRPLCSECHLAESTAKTPREKKSDPDE
jgi:formylmethanofuran dehydrogenase subunit E